MTTHPAQRTIAARIFTNAGWLVGTFHVPESERFDEFLGSSTPYFKLTDVTLPAGPATLEFFALRRDAAIVVVPQVEVEALRLSDTSGSVVTHDVACLLETGIILGTLDLPGDVRVSDHLATHGGFTDLRACQWVSGTPKLEAPVAFVNSPRIIGITERDS